MQTVGRGYSSRSQRSLRGQLHPESLGTRCRLLVRHGGLLGSWEEDGGIVFFETLEHSQSPEDNNVCSYRHGNIRSCKPNDAAGVGLFS
jgi:hypothetical protein